MKTRSGGFFFAHRKFLNKVFDTILNVVFNTSMPRLNTRHREQGRRYSPGEPLCGERHDPVAGKREKKTKRIASAVGLEGR